jgi:hypothetical protein
MPLKFKSQTLLSVVLGFLALLPAGASAQTANSQSRITQQVNESQRTVLFGNTHPLAQAKYDKGLVSASLPLDRMSLILKRSPAQEAALQTLLAQQQDKKSPNYHKWLTAAQFGQLFGPSDQDIQKVTAWLTTHGFIVDQVATGRQFIQFSGTAGEVEEAFKAPLHNLSVNGKQHIANMTDPSVPTALASVVGGVRSLHDFFPKGQNHAKLGTRARPTIAATVKPKFTFPGTPPPTGNNTCNVLGSPNCFGIGPADLATIYSIPTSVDGTGVTIDIMADSNINLADVSDFQSQFGLPMKAPTVVVPAGSSNPGLLPGPDGDEIEAILDVEWAGAVAQNATINLIVSKSSNTTFGGDLDAEFVVDGNSPPPILSESFGECELGLGTAGNTFYNNLWTQGAAEGITIIISSGDNGSAGCDVQQVDNSTPTGAAQLGLAVNGVASTGANVAVGGTDFNDLTNPLTYWTVGNNPVTAASALSYIPESTWNDACTNAVFITEFNGQFGNDAQTVCNNATIVSAGFDLPVGGSGGKSACTTSDGTTPSSCTGGNAKPAFQSGVTTDTTRDIPDISLFAGDGEISASFYVVCERDFTGDGGAACNLSTGPFLEVGGTSVSTQVFAGVMALVIQNNALGRQGNPDTVLYSLAKAEFAANCDTNNPQPHSTCVFNDVTTGTIAMPCVTASPDCTTNASVVPPAVRVNRPTPTTFVTLVCAFCVGLMLICFRGRSRAWTTALVLLAAVAFTANAGCGGGGNGGGGGGGGSGGTPAIGVQNGYSAGTGYDLATGLGSVNVGNLIVAHGFAAAPDINVPPTAPVAPALLRRMDVRDWQPSVRAIAITFVFCLGMILLGFRQRSRRLNAAMVLTAITLLTLTAGIARFHGYAPHVARGAESSKFALARR